MGSRKEVEVEVLSKFSEKRLTRRGAPSLDSRTTKRTKKTRKELGLWFPIIFKTKGEIDSPERPNFIAQLVGSESYPFSTEFVGKERGW